MISQNDKDALLYHLGQAQHRLNTAAAIARKPDLDNPVVPSLVNGLDGLELQLLDLMRNIADEENS